jgi:hypothetical protein
MERLKQINKTKFLIHYEQLYIQSHYHHKQLIPEQYSGEYNPMYELVYDQKVKPHPTKPPDLHLQPQAQYASRPTTCNQPKAISARNSHQKLLV